ncbi:MAG: hypothetical protein JWL87_9 [Candidatus Adlerbacteria bacterium]|nr:hypothetical protein [Candidatus Adlerbacteria bacterium]
MAHAFSFIAMGTLSYHVHMPKHMHILSFGTTF